MSNKRMIETPNGTIDLTLDDSITQEPVELGLRSRLRSGRKDTSQNESSSSTPKPVNRGSGSNKRGPSTLQRFLNESTDLERVTPGNSPDVVFIGMAENGGDQSTSSAPGCPAKKLRRNSPSKKLALQEVLHSGRSSLESSVLTCPICFDTQEKVLKTGRHWSSTICGHVYCNECIDSSIAAQGCCPNCRKKLTKRSVHPLYL